MAEILAATERTLKFCIEMRYLTSHKEERKNKKHDLNMVLLPIALVPVCGIGDF